MATTPVAFTQLFRNGEIWGVTGESAVQYYDKRVVPMVNVSNVYRETLASYIATAQDALGVPPPYDVEMGAVGLWTMCLSLPVPNPNNEVSGPVHDGEFKRRSILNDISEASQQTLVEQLIAGLTIWSASLHDSVNRKRSQKPWSEFRPPGVDA